MESSEEEDDFPSIESIIPQSKVDSLYQSHTEKVRSSSNFSINLNCLFCERSSQILLPRTMTSLFDIESLEFCWFVSIHFVRELTGILLSPNLTFLLCFQLEQSNWFQYNCRDGLLIMSDNIINLNPLIFMWFGRNSWVVSVLVWKSLTLVFRHLGWENT